MRVAAVVLSLLLPACSAKSHWVTVPVAAAADVVTTEVAIREYDKVELNPMPWAQTTAGRIVATAVWTALMLWFIEKLHNEDHHGWAKGFEFGGVAFKGGLAAHNIKEMQE